MDVASSCGGEQRRAERRRHRRLALAFPVRFSGRSARGSTVHAQGLTVDISPGGVRFEAQISEPVAAQTEIALHIAIHRHGESSDSPMFLSGRATVLRCEPVGAGSRQHTGARWALAARFHKHPDVGLPVIEDFSPGAGAC
jgi:hypothetical protein